VSEAHGVCATLTRLLLPWDDAILLLLLLWFLGTLYMAVVSARNRRFCQHRHWVLRHAGSGLWVAVMRLFVVGQGKQAYAHAYICTCICRNASLYPYYLTINTNTTISTNINIDINIPLANGLPPTLFAYKSPQSHRKRTFTQFTAFASGETELGRLVNFTLGMVFGAVVAVGMSEVAVWASDSGSGGGGGGRIKKKRL